METPEASLEVLLEKAEAYSKTTFELSKLRSLETMTRTAITVTSRLGVMIAFSLFALVLSVGIAQFLGELLGHNYFGFFIVAAFYLIAGIVFRRYLHQWIKKPLSNLIITQALK